MQPCRSDVTGTGELSISFLNSSLQHQWGNDSERCRGIFHGQLVDGLLTDTGFPQCRQKRVMKVIEVAHLAAIGLAHVEPTSAGKPSSTDVRARVERRGYRGIVRFFMGEMV